MADKTEQRFKALEKKVAEIDKMKTALKAWHKELVKEINKAHDEMNAWVEKKDGKILERISQIEEIQKEQIKKLARLHEGMEVVNDSAKRYIDAHNKKQDERISKIEQQVRKK